jgi:Ca-activated chloride channel family protein
MGCNTLAEVDGLASGGQFGATQGGVQDMSFARDLVDSGQVPPAEAFFVEGMFSEHDLPLEGAPCATTLCLSSALGIAPTVDESPAAWLQVGLSSNVNPATYERPSIAMVATVDVSGSMGWGYGGSDSAGAISRELLTRIAGQLHEGDRFAMVTYGSDVQTLLPPVAGDSGLIAQAIASLSENGSTNMEAGLVEAYRVAQQMQGSADEVRVMLFTDVQPNVGATSAGSFESMAAAGAEEGIGLTVLGLGLGMGAEVFRAMSHLEGGNAFSLTGAEDVAPFMDDNWPWMVSPIAYDLHVAISPVGDFRISNLYGFPASDDGSASLDVATVFLSKNKGALLVELAPEQLDTMAAAEASLTLSYRDANGEAYEQALNASYGGEALDGRGVHMPEQGIAKAVALALLVRGMKEACQLYADDRIGAIARLDDALARFDADAGQIFDADIAAEAAFWPKLAELMRAGAPQGSLYP